MKWLLYSLLLVNLVIFVWHYQSTSSNSSPDTADDLAAAGAVSLVLLHEYVENVKHEIPPRNLCFSLGPFKSKEQSSLAAKIIRTETHFEPEPRMRKDAKRKAFWVILPPAESKELARQNVSKLKKKNVSDYFLVVNGEQTNAVSLGVFAKFESAHRRIKQIQEMGFTPRVEKVNLPKKEVWLEWAKTSEEHLTKDMLFRLEKIQKGLTVIERACS
jgi:hypothetical protein